MEQEGFGTDLLADYEPVSHAINAPYATTSAPAHAETDDDSYVYQPLDTDWPRVPYIRLITVWHGTRSASYPYPRTKSKDILCTINIFEVNSAPPYVALSYTWGNPIPLYHIRLNGKTHSIRGNLRDFLDAFGLSSAGQQEHYLWVDQLCIDQSNKIERGNQVELMGDIYRNAQFVISWLGWSGYHAFRGIVRRKLGHKRRVAHMTTVLSNRYFSRLWIVQEFLLAKDVQFMCGDALIHLETLSSRLWDLTGYSGFDECRDARHLIHARGGSAKFNTKLINVLARYSQLGCEDSRDQVYGLLGIVDPFRHVPEVNYQKSAEQVYLDTVRIIFTEDRDRSAGLTVNCAEMLGRNMCLRPRHLSAILQLLKHIGQRCNSASYAFFSRPTDPVVDSIGFDPPESPDKWWYEYRGFRYVFSVQSDAIVLPISAHFEHLVTLNCIQ